MSYQLKITLDDVDPPIWRRVLVPSEFTLLDLHHVIQVAMGWEDDHLHDFTINRKRYGLPGPEGFDDEADESETLLRDVVKPRSKLVYQYDFGDSWKHIILVEKTLDDAETSGPICVDGARACPPEDSGGAWGYTEKLQALAGELDDDEDSEDLREWLGEDFDPERFDVNAVNKTLQKVFRPAPSKKKKSARRK